MADVQAMLLRHDAHFGKGDAQPLKDSHSCTGHKKKADAAVDAAEVERLLGAHAAAPIDSLLTSLGTVITGQHLSLTWSYTGNCPMHIV